MPNSKLCYDYPSSMEDIACPRPGFDIQSHLGAEGLEAKAIAKELRFGKANYVHRTIRSIAIGGQTYEVESVLYNSLSVSGRGTVAFKVKRPGESEATVLKLSWPSWTGEGSMCRELEMHELCKESPRFKPERNLAILQKGLGERGSTDCCVNQRKESKRVWQPISILPLCSMR